MPTLLKWAEVLDIKCESWRCSTYHADLWRFEKFAYDYAMMMMMNEIWWLKLWGYVGIVSGDLPESIRDLVFCLCLHTVDMVRKNKLTPKIFCSFLSSRFEFQSKILLTYLVILYTLKSLITI